MWENVWQNVRFAVRTFIQSPGVTVLVLLTLAVGIGRVVAWSVSRRTSEIGLRMALGVRPLSILSMIARESLTS
jgi:ABC-type antimicrobial peptide transport system permease subunit